MNHEHSVRHHPSSELLAGFSQGMLSTGLSVAVSAHLEFCEQCLVHVRQQEEQAASEWSDSKAGGFSSHDAAELVASIASLPQLAPVSPPQALLRDCHFEDRSVRLPRVLSLAVGTALVWKKAGGGINQARVGIDDQAQCDLMYMKAGSRAPLHTHRGSEVTLVLDGRFHDELGSYGPGDFLLRNDRDLHTPASDDGCLCFAVLDRPLTFTSGFARLLNPVQSLLFNR